MSFMDLSSIVRKIIPWQQVENERIHSATLTFKLGIRMHLLGTKARCSLLHPSGLSPFNRLLEGMPK